MTLPRQSVGLQTGKTTAAFADFLVDAAGIKPDPPCVGRTMHGYHWERHFRTANARVGSRYLVRDALPMWRAATTACALAEAAKSPPQQRVRMTIWREGREEPRHDIGLAQMV